jgi:hypothetical protein
MYLLTLRIHRNAWPSCSKTPQVPVVPTRPPRGWSPSTQAKVVCLIPAGPPMPDQNQTRSRRQHRASAVHQDQQADRKALGPHRVALPSWRGCGTRILSQVRRCVVEDPMNWRLRGIQSSRCYAVCGRSSFPMGCCVTAALRADSRDPRRDADHPAAPLLRVLLETWRSVASTPPLDAVDRQGDREAHNVFRSSCRSRLFNSHGTSEVAAMPPGMTQG